MLQIKPQTNETLIPNSVDPTQAIEFINSHIDRNSCEHLSVDISFMNVIDACYVSTLCSTKHFTKYPKGKINWKISSEAIKEFGKDFELGNSNYTL